MRVIYQIDPGPIHKLELVEITGNKDFLDTAKLRSYLQIQPARRLLSHGRYSEALLKSDVATLEALYRSSGFRQAKITTKVDDNYHGEDNRSRFISTLKKECARLSARCMCWARRRSRSAPSRTVYATRPALFRAGSGERPGKNPELLLRSWIPQRHARHLHQA